VLKNIGKKGQEKLLKSKVVIIGCGALGTTIVDNLVRSGIGNIRIIDRDIIELNNLQRQHLFDENDIGKPKALIAAKKLKKINSEINIEYFIDDVNQKNIENLIRDVDLVLDGTDNMTIRFLINDACIKNDIPWIYGGAIETYGISMNIIPNVTACFRCIINKLPETGVMDTCDTVGVLNTIPNIIGSIQGTEAIKILSGKENSRKIITFDVWSQVYNSFEIEKRKDCICCGKKDFEYLDRVSKERIITLCGSGVIQITPAYRMNTSIEKLGEKLKNIGTVIIEDGFLRFQTEDFHFYVFKDGRALIYGTADENIAKSIYSKYIGL
jgi:adenylyltransferase/sulfurtransferase